jgi:hypothetical protein
MDSVSLMTNENLPYFPVALHTLDYNNNNNEIEKKKGERTSDYIIRLGKTRSDKRFCCVGTSCSFKLNMYTGDLKEGEENPHEKTLLPRKIESGSIILDVDETVKKHALTYENQKFVIKKLQFFQDTFFTWNQNQDVAKKTRDIYLHDGELHLHFETLNPGRPANIVVVIGLKNDANGRSILPKSFLNEPNSTTFTIEEVFPSLMSFFTYDMDNENTRVIVMENFVKMNNFENIVRIIQERGSVLPSDIKQPLTRPLDTSNLAMYGFLKVNEEKRKGDYEDKVYYQDEKRVRYNPNIVESNRVKTAQEKIFFKIKIPHNFKLIRKDDIGPLQSFLHPTVFNLVYIGIMILCAGVVYIQGIQYDNFWNMVLFSLAFWLVVSIGFIIALASGRGYYKKKLSAIATNDPEKEQKEQELNDIIGKIANPGTFIITIFSVFVAGVLIYVLIGYIYGAPNPFRREQQGGEEVGTPVVATAPVEGEPGMTEAELEAAEATARGLEATETARAEEATARAEEATAQLGETGQILQPTATVTEQPAQPVPLPPGELERRLEAIEREGGGLPGSLG